MRSNILILVFSHIISLVSIPVVAQNFNPGKSYFTDCPYIEYIEGNMPLIISVPHDGGIMPENIPERKGRVAKNRDIHTIEIARIIQKKIHKETGRYPYIIINHIHRTRLDANRGVETAAMGNETAIKAWNSYHRCIQRAKDSVISNFGKGLYIDLHGHRHKIDRIELGYNLSGEELRLDEELLNSGLLDEYITIKNLLNNNTQDALLTDLISGNQSLGAFLQKQGQQVVPSPSSPFPLNDEAFFGGGYNTITHGSASGGSIDGIQIEIGLATRTDKKLRIEVAKDIANSLLEFIEFYYSL